MGNIGKSCHEYALFVPSDGWFYRTAFCRSTTQVLFGIAMRSSDTSEHGYLSSVFRQVGIVYEPEFAIVSPWESI